MRSLIPVPTTVQINAWSPNSANTGPLMLQTTLGLQRHFIKEQLRPNAFELGPPEAPDPEDWRHPEVGWGLVLPDNPKLADDVKARGEDAPEPLRRLLAARGGAPVLRWSPTQTTLMLRRYYVDGPPEDLLAAAPTYGIGRSCIPRYLLLYGTPTAIPWVVQYALNLSLCVGRLDLTPEEGLGNYIDALLADWGSAHSDPSAPLVWSVDHGEADITWLMARAIADPLVERFKGDTELTKYLQLKDRDATGQNLLTALVERKPGLVITTSHGMTGPLGDGPALAAQLGLPVDASQQAVPLADFKKWQPDGAIWYAHACCAAGSDHTTRYIDLVPAGSGIRRILEGVAQGAGARVAPLPRALLGASAPLRAFIGHVEPTFDWTLRQPTTGQMLTCALKTALYKNLYQKKVRTPVAWALREVFKQSGALYGAWQDAMDADNKEVAGARDLALFRNLAARDLQTLVILGDPTVALRPL